MGCSRKKNLTFFLIVILYLIEITFSSKLNEPSFSFFVITDIHQDYKNLQSIINQIKEEGDKYDYVICAGDIVSVPINKNDDPETMIQYSNELNKIITELEKIAPVIWVPGNHEPGNAYNSSKLNITLKGINLHKQVLMLEDKLYIVGLGGNVPILEGGKYSPGYVPFSTLDYKNFKYAGYPYNIDNNYELSDEKYSEDLNEQIQKAKMMGDDIQMILLTHNGPSYTSTNLLVENGDIMYLGSKNLGLAFEEENFFLNIHGHTHAGKGFVNLPDNKYVINPGAAQQGHYSKIKIKKNSEGLWYVESASLDRV